MKLYFNTQSIPNGTKHTLNESVISFHQGREFGGNKMESVEFLDSITESTRRDEGPKLHHFRSSSIPKEEEYLCGCWEKCVQSHAVCNIKLPAHFLYLPDDNGNMQRTECNKPASTSAHEYDMSIELTPLENPTEKEGEAEAEAEEQDEVEEEEKEEEEF